MAPVLHPHTSGMTMKQITYYGLHDFIASPNVLNFSACFASYTLAHMRPCLPPRYTSMIVGKAFARRCATRQSWSETTQNIAPVGGDIKYLW